jgi:hypothetical protein
MIKQKSKEWLKRYLPSEIVGTITAIGAASLTHLFYDKPITIAYAGSLGEAIGFYLTMFIQNLFIINKKRKVENKFLSFHNYFIIIRSMLFEFGPAGLIDGLLLRPFFMYIFPLILKNFTLGILLGKIAGDITFYFLIILSYELNKRRAANK